VIIILYDINYKRQQNLLFNNSVKKYAGKFFALSALKYIFVYD